MKLSLISFKGYDFRDYVKEIQDKDLIIENLLNLIWKEVKDEL